MTIRPATLEDVPRIVAMGLRFAASEYAAFLPATAPCIEALVRGVLAGDTATIFVAADATVVGMYGVMTYTHPMTGEVVGSEMFWWMEPEARGSSAALQLHETAVAWARTRGAVRYDLIAPTDKVGRFYERRLGFTRTEIHYQRSLA